MLTLQPGGAGRKGRSEVRSWNTAMAGPERERQSIAHMLDMQELRE